VAFNVDLEIISLAMNRIDRATHEAIGIGAGATRTGHEEFIEPLPIANQSRYPFMRIRAGARAFIATGTTFEIDHQHPLRVKQALLREAIEHSLLYTLPLVAV
jgi:hypothetical protein